MEIFVKITLLKIFVHILYVVSSVSGIHITPGALEVLLNNQATKVFGEHPGLQDNMVEQPNSATYIVRDVSNDVVLQYVLGEVKDEVNTLSKAMGCPCSVASNFQMGSNFNEVNEIGNLVGYLLKENSFFVLEQVKAIISYSLAMEMQKLDKRIEEKTTKIVADAIFNLQLALNEINNTIGSVVLPELEGNLGDTVNSESSELSKNITTPTDSDLDSIDKADTLMTEAELTTSGAINVVKTGDDRTNNTTPELSQKKKFIAGFQRPNRTGTHRPSTPGRHPNKVKIFKKRRPTGRPQLVRKPTEEPLTKSSNSVQPPGKAGSRVKSVPLYDFAANITKDQ